MKSGATDSGELLKQGFNSPIKYYAHFPLTQQIVYTIHSQRLHLDLSLFNLPLRLYRPSDQVNMISLSVENQSFFLLNQHFLLISPH